MRIRLRRGELAIIALTLMFACFMGGYFAGRRGAVNLVPVPSAAAGSESDRSPEPQDSPGDSGSTQSSAPGVSGGAQGAVTGGGGVRTARRLRTQAPAHQMSSRINPARCVKTTEGST